METDYFNDDLENCVCSQEVNENIDFIHGN